MVPILISCAIEYLPAIFSGQTPEDFIAEKLPKMKDKQAQQLKVLFQAQRLTQRMYNSYTLLPTLNSMAVNRVMPLLVPRPHFH